MFKKFNDDFFAIVSPAARSSDLGRGSGGIIVLIRRSIFSHNVIKVHPNFVSFSVTHLASNITFAIVVHYFSPSLDQFFCCQLLEDNYSDLLRSFRNIVLLGDFNAKIGELNQLDIHCIIPEQLSYCRVTKCSELNKRGEIFCDTFESHGFFVLNGRSKSDSPANYTYVNEGQSVIDLAWCHQNCAELVTDFKVRMLPVSDHDACVVTLNLDSSSRSDSIRLNPRIRVTQENAETLSNLLLNSTLQTDFDGIKNIIVNACRDAGMFYTPVIRTNKPWFDGDCRTALQLVNRCYSRYISCPTSHTREFFVNARKEYVQTVKTKKRLYSEEIQLKLADCHSRSAFWKTVNMYRNRKGANCDLTKSAWEAFYDKELGNPGSADILDEFPGIHVPALDCPFTLEEYLLSLHKLNPKKSPGPDMIPNSVLRCLPIDIHVEILRLFNQFYESGKLPSSFGEIEMVMIYKKGDKNLPENYRGIALANTLTKLFTTILCNRLTEWAETNNKLPETQAGFRKGRGCLDQIFSLMCIVQIKLRNISSDPKKRRYGKLYALFVDLRRAFDSINHCKLWRKLHSLGVSTKVINVLISLYSSAKMKVRTIDGFTKEYCISQGVLQGEVLSPLLFALYVSDIDEFINDRMCNPVSLGGSNSVHCLMLADDNVTMAETREGLQEKINALADYFDLNDLTVNLSKTKVMVFRRGGSVSRKDKLYYKGQLIEIVNTYTYLGIVMSYTGLFKQACKDRMSKARSALGSALSLCSSANIYSWVGRTKLFDSIVVNSLLYAAPVWCLCYLDDIETIQTNFLKRSLCLPICTTNYVLRCETGRVPLKCFVFSNLMKFLLSILKLGHNRLVRVCYNRLYYFDRPNDTTRTERRYARYNWVTLVRHLLEDIGYTDVWESQDPVLLEDKLPEICLAYRNRCKDLDTSSLITSTSNPLYFLTWSKWHTAKYLLYHLPFSFKSLVAQVRLNSRRLYFRGMSLQLGCDYCTFCDSLCEMSLDHPPKMQSFC